jgi:hypothetical protein
MSSKIVFFNTGWMDFYKGLRNDSITGGGQHIEDEGWGGEIFNYKSFKNNYYGYVQPKIDKKYGNPCTIKLERFGAEKTDKSFKGVTVVWTAKDPYNGGTYIIGWYKNATVFRYTQYPPRNSKRWYKNELMEYYATTQTSNARLLSVDERIVKVQRQKKKWMGESNVWYADKNPGFIQIVKDYIYKGIIPTKTKGRHKHKSGSRQSDPLKRIEVEKKAILIVTKYFQKLGFKIQSFEKDNIGWDLTAKNKKSQLKLEVKGLSGNSIASELTPNEFKNLKADEKFYRLCIVINAVTKPKLKIFAHSSDKNEWASEDGTVLRFEEVKSARIYG